MKNINSPKLININSSILQNSKGMSILAVLLASTIGFIVILALNKFSVGISEKVHGIAHKSTLIEIKRNVFDLLRNQNAWIATSQHKATLQNDLSCIDCNEEDRCYPGEIVKENSTDTEGAFCPMEFWYNPRNPKTQVEYLEDSELKRWIAPIRVGGVPMSEEVAPYAKGLAFFTLNGQAIDLSSCEEDNPEDCDEVTEHIGKYLRVAIEPSNVIGNTATSSFKLTITDSALTKNITTFTINISQMEEMNDSNLLYGKYIAKNSISATTHQCLKDIDTVDLKALVIENCALSETSSEECYIHITQYDDSEHYRSFILKATYYATGSYGSTTDLIALDITWNIEKDKRLYFDSTKDGFVHKDDWWLGEVKVETNGGHGVGIDKVTDDLEFCVKRDRYNTMFKLIKR